MCRIAVETPVGLSSQQKDLLRQFQASMSKEDSRHNPRKSNWFEGVRRFFDGL
jgi:molecular chaperone DnaJ